MLYLRLNTKESFEYVTNDTTFYFLNAVVMF